MALFVEGLVGLIAWAFLTGLPAFAAFWSWRFSRRLRRRWLVHLAFAPALISVEWLGVEAFFIASGDTGDGPPGLGLLFVPTICVLGVALVGYFSVLSAVGLHGLYARLRA
jgi:hypothetical protein